MAKTKTQSFSNPDLFNWLSHCVRFLDNSKTDALPESIELMRENMEQSLADWTAAFMNEMKIPTEKDSKKVIIKSGYGTNEINIEWYSNGMMSFWCMESYYGSSRTEIIGPAFNTVSDDPKDMEERLATIKLERLKNNLNTILNVYGYERSTHFQQYAALSSGNIPWDGHQRYMMAQFLHKELLGEKVNQKIKKLQTIKAAAQKFKNNLPDIDAQYVRIDEFIETLKTSLFDINLLMAQAKITAQATRLITERVERDILNGTYNNNAAQWDESCLCQTMTGANVEDLRKDRLDTNLIKDSKDVLANKSLIRWVTPSDIHRYILTKAEVERGNASYYSGDDEETIEARNRKYEESLQFMEEMNLPYNDTKEFTELMESLNINSKQKAMSIVSLFPELLNMKQEDYGCYRIMTPISKAVNDCDSLKTEYKSLMIALLAEDDLNVHTTRIWSSETQEVKANKKLFDLKLPTAEFTEYIRESCESNPQIKQTNCRYGERCDIYLNFGKMYDALPVSCQLNLNDIQLDYPYPYQSPELQNILSRDDSLLQDHSITQKFYDLVKELAFMYLNNETEPTYEDAYRLVETMLNERKVKTDQKVNGIFITPNSPEYQGIKAMLEKTIDQMLENLQKVENALMTSEYPEFIQWCIDEKMIDKKAGQARLQELEDAIIAEKQKVDAAG